MLLHKKIKIISVLVSMLIFPSILNAQYIDTKWTVTGYFGELWYAEEEDILGKQQEFFKGWADGVFYSCDYAGQSATYNSHTIKEFVEATCNYLDYDIKWEGEGVNEIGIEKNLEKK